MKYLQATLHITDTENREIAMAQLAEHGFESFEERDDVLLAYISEDSVDLQSLDALLQEYGVRYQLEVIEQQNWNKTWEESFDPVHVGDFCTIRATFHQPDTSVQHEIIITPKMSFGTGHHATTRLMIQQMSGLSFENKEILDFGTGTGVLAILAQKLGAKGTLAIDTDEWSYENTIENVGHNNTAGIEVRKGSLEIAKGSYDIILANINRHILLQYMFDMKGMLNDSGCVLMSGILKEDEALIEKEATKAGLKMQDMIVEEQWICLKFTVA